MLKKAKAVLSKETLLRCLDFSKEFEIELSCGGEYESGTLITDEDPDTYEMTWVFSVEDSSSQEEDEDLQENLFQEMDNIYQFDDELIAFETKYSISKDEKIKKFKENYPRFKIIL